MLRVVLLLITSSIILAGCANSKVEYKPPYCYTDQTILKENNKNISSQTIVQCSDKPGQQAMIQRAGIDANCREFEMMEPRWGTLVPVRGVRCKKHDGTWEILNLNGYAR